MVRLGRPLDLAGYDYETSPPQIPPSGRGRCFAADGLTLLLAVSSSAINATLYSNLSFNFIRDIAPVAMIGLTPFVMVVNPKLPTKTVPEFIAYAKANPGKINMASQGNGL